MQRSLLLLLICCALGTACRSVTVKGKPYIDAEAMTKNAPRSLAILPTTDVSNHPELRIALRRALFDAFSALPYQDVRLERIDEYLARLALQRGIRPEDLPVESQVIPGLADCVVFSEIERVRRFYAIFYSHVRIDMRMSLVDTRTRAVIYRNNFRLYNRAGGPSITILGLIERAMSSLWHLREAEFDDALAAGARKIAESVPAPSFELQGGPSLFLSDVKITLPRPKLGIGDQVIVEAAGSPYCHSTFSIGRVARRVALKETSPGRYRGVYTVKDGDNAPYAAVEIDLRSQGENETLNYMAEEQAFVIDTDPPSQMRIEHWWPRDESGGIFLSMTLESSPLDALRGVELPTRQFIYRRGPGEVEFHLLGEAHEMTWLDETAEASKAYSYYVITEDEAGNRSKPGSVTSTAQPQRATPPAPPTVVKP